MRKYLFTEGFAWTSYHDTSFGNRILVWELAQTLNKLNNYEYDIVVQNGHDVIWGEMEFLKYPNTYPLSVFPKLKFTERIGDIQNYKTFNLNQRYIHFNITVECFHWLQHKSNIVTETYKKTNHRPIFDIEIYDKKLENAIKKEVENRVGIHIRADSSNGFWQPANAEPNELSRKLFIKQELDKYVEKGLDKFYLSTDCFTHPRFRLTDQEFHKYYSDTYGDTNDIIGEFYIETIYNPAVTLNKDDKFWENAFYEPDKEEYIWINTPSGRPAKILKILQKGEEFEKERNWIKELYDEYDIIDYRSVLKRYDTFLHYLSKLRCIEVIDLFSLIHSVEFTDNTGNQNGTFAKFVKNYRKKFE